MSTVLRGVAALVLLLALVAGCGGGDSPETTGEASTVPVVDAYPDDPEAQKTLDRFIQAAGRKDATAMWNLLDKRSQQLFGPTEKQWAAGLGRELIESLGPFAGPKGEYSPVLARKISKAWSVAAVSGTTTAAGQEEVGAYAAVVGREGGERKIALGGTVSFSPIVPESELRTDSRPEIAMEVTAREPILTSALWVDQTPAEPLLSADAYIMSGEVAAPLEPGRHTIVVYAGTESGAGATAWTFTSG